MPRSRRSASVHVNVRVFPVSLRNAAQTNRVQEMLTMSVLLGKCPACGAPVEFKSGQSIVVICGYCHSAVARTDRELKDLGKVAELVETGSPLDVGVRGSFRDVPFELTGRAQLGHQMGGQW